jgi:chemotaxis receptor (MCP) glutamine deamidase CheD
MKPIVGDVLQVPIGGIEAMRAPGGLSTLLGSCVGLLVQDMKRRIAVLAHVVRAHGIGAGMGPGYFANQALPRTIDLAIKHGALRKDLMVRLAGGGQMVDCKTGIGNDTVTVLRDAVQAEGLIFGGFVKGPRDGGCFLVVDASTGRAEARPLTGQKLNDRSWRSLNHSPSNKIRAGS